jgi:hypothetical protein
VGVEFRRVNQFTELLGSGAATVTARRQHRMVTVIEASERGGGPMSPGTLHGRRSLDIVFGLFLASGVTVGAYRLWAAADWIHSLGEDAFGSVYLGAFSFDPPC